MLPSSSLPWIIESPIVLWFAIWVRRPPCSRIFAFPPEPTNITSLVIVIAVDISIEMRWHVQVFAENIGC